MNRKIYVTEAGYDDIGAILKSLGEGYKYNILQWNKLSLDVLSHNDILFLNCHTHCKRSAGKLKNQLRDFVSKGGILYASDWAGALVAEAFGDFLAFSDDGQAQTLSVQVVDSGLRELLGNTISLNFDLGGWWKISKVKKEAKTYLSHGKTPLSVSFKVGSGYVLYTSFHNKSQVSKLERVLLEYLVFRPLLSKVVDQAAEQAVSANFTVDKEIIASTKNVQDKNTVYKLTIDKPATILAILGWEGAAKFELTLENPQNITIKKVFSEHGPLGIDFFAKELGDWTIKVTPLSLPYPNFPFALTLAKGGEKQTIKNQAGSAIQIQNATAGTSAFPLSGAITSQTNSAPANNPVTGKIDIQIQAPNQSLLPPLMFPILNMGGLPDYEIRWMPQAGQDGYILEEASSSAFADAVEVYAGHDTIWRCSGKPKGIYFYRVCAYQGSFKSSWSEMQSTSVLHG